MNNKTTLRCPLCNRKLAQKKCGMVCGNYKCKLFWKLGGWCLKDSVWRYTDNGIDKVITWDKAHPNVVYPPLKGKIHERHLDALIVALQKDETLCFIIPTKYCFGDSEVVQE